MAGSGSVPKSAMGFGVSLGLYQSLRVDGIVHDLADIPTCLGRIQYLPKIATRSKNVEFTAITQYEQMLQQR